jgi:hypothetical protein
MTNTVRMLPGNVHDCTEIVFQPSGGDIYRWMEVLFVDKAGNEVRLAVFSDEPKTMVPTIREKT